MFQVIAAEGEQKASRALREAAEVVRDFPSMGFSPVLLHHFGIMHYMLSYYV